MKNPSPEAAIKEMALSEGKRGSSVSILNTRRIVQPQLKNIENFATSNRRVFERYLFSLAREFFNASL